MLEYTEMKIEHYDLAYKLWQECEEIELTVGDTRESLNKYLKRNPGLSFVCMDKETGSLTGTILCGHDGRRGAIFHLAVKNEYRNKSIGKTLMNLSLDALKKEGIQRCILMVKSGNKMAMSFWIKMGWNKRDELNMFSKNLEG